MSLRAHIERIIAIIKNNEFFCSFSFFYRQLFDQGASVHRADPQARKKPDAGLDTATATAAIGWQARHIGYGVELVVLLCFCPTVHYRSLKLDKRDNPFGMTTVWHSPDKKTGRPGIDRPDRFIMFAAISAILFLRRSR